MTTGPRRHVALLLLALAGLAACAQPPQAGAAASTAAAREQAGLEAGVEAVAYGFPLVIMDATRRKLTNVAVAGPLAAPVNQFAHMSRFPDASFKDVVRANVDTLYSSAWLDLSREPMVLSLPDTGGRYYLMPMLDAWTDIFASPGKRTTGTGAGHYAITGPRWSGSLPAGVQRIEAPTDMVWIIGRTQAKGPDDYAAVHALQQQYRLAPLSAFGRPWTPPSGTLDPSVDMQLAPVEAVERLGTAGFLDALAQLLAKCPPPPADAPVLARLAALGVVPGKAFDPSGLDADFARGLQRALPEALQRLQAGAKQTGAPVNGWRIPSLKLGAFGTDYATRAVVALIGLGANLAADAVYPSTFVDTDGQPLSGAHRYVLRFEPGHEPPARAFWSVTMYDGDSFFVANPIDRYALSSWMPLQRGADGALELLVQHEAPAADRASNWLPAPAGEFNLTLRMYWPADAAPSILDGSWTPPGVKRVE